MLCPQICSRLVLQAQTPPTGRSQRKKNCCSARRTVASLIQEREVEECRAVWYADGALLPEDQAIGSFLKGLKQPGRFRGCDMKVLCPVKMRSRPMFLRNGSGIDRGRVDADTAEDPAPCNVHAKNANGSCGIRMCTLVMVPLLGRLHRFLSGHCCPSQLRQHGRAGLEAQTKGDKRSLDHGTYEVRITLPMAAQAEAHLAGSLGNALGCCTKHGHQSFVPHPGLPLVLRVVLKFYLAVCSILQIRSQTLEIALQGL